MIRSAARTSELHAALPAPPTRPTRWRRRDDGSRGMRPEARGQRSGSVHHRRQSALPFGRPPPPSEPSEFGCEGRPCDKGGKLSVTPSRPTPTRHARARPPAHALLPALSLPRDPHVSSRPNRLLPAVRSAAETILHTSTETRLSRPHALEERSRAQRRTRVLAYWPAFTADWIQYSKSKFERKARSVGRITNCS